MPETSTAKKIYKWKPFTSRPVGRSKYRLEDVRNDLKKMRLIKWTEQIKDRLKWKVTARKPRLYQSCSVEEEGITKNAYKHRAILYSWCQISGYMTNFNIHLQFPIQHFKA
jgi:hypothetical protein